uniref:Uncharacterized protein n=1 Tax=Anatid alphaherpesvirus 2 TaxID=3080522 RepID=A0AAU0K6J0_9ALPH
MDVEIDQSRSQPSRGRGIKIKKFFRTDPRVVFNVREVGGGGGGGGTLGGSRVGNEPTFGREGGGWDPLAVCQLIGHAHYMEMGGGEERGRKCCLWGVVCDV